MKKEEEVTSKFHLINGRADIQPRSFFDFFKHSAIYQVPLYQRPYSWETNHVNQLLTDVTKSIETNQSWFLGPIFTASEDYDAIHEQKIINLLDGQQRITTLILISRVISSLEYFSEGFDFNLLGDLGDYQRPNGSQDDDKIKNFMLELKSNINHLSSKILVLDEPGKDIIPKFRTGESSNKEFSDWILDLKNINDKESYSLYKNLSVSSGNDFEITKQNLNKNIDFIYDFFENKLEKGIGNNPAKGLVFINNFIEKLLTGLYFIHIPLKEKDDVLDIFETINNRGKRLKLTDIIRFTTLKEFIGNSAKQNKLGNLWSKLYMMMQKYHCFFKDADEFVERYINSISESKNGYTNDDDRVARFKEEYSSDYIIGMKKMSHCVNMIDYIFDEEKFVKDLNSKGKTEDSKKLSCLIILLKEVFLLSKNSHVLFMGYFNRVHTDVIHTKMINSNKLDGCNNLLIFLWQFVKYVLACELYANLRSNIVRNKFFSLAQKINTCNIYNKTADPQAKVSDEYLLENQKLNGQNESYVKNLAKQRVSQKSTTLLLYYFQFLENYSQLNTSKSIDNKNCDHIIPDKWYSKDCWIEKIINNDYVINLQTQEKAFHQNVDRSNKFSNIILEFIDKELWNDSNSDDSFIQLIGNKVYIDGTLNRLKSNKCWIGKKGAKESMREYMMKKANSAFIIPTYKPPYHEDDFGLAEITNRTSYIIRKICSESDLNWGSIR